MHARYVILQVLLQNGGGVVKVNTIGPGGDDIIVQLDKSKIESHGKPAIGDFLLKLQVMGCRGVAT